MGEKNAQSVGVHDGSFHADEVTACALLVLFECATRDKIVRTRDPEKLATCEFVCDVGGIYDPKQKLFDHHQADYDGPLSSAGMVLLYLRDEGIIDEALFNLFDLGLVRGVDAHDNGRASQEAGTATFSHVIANFTPFSYEATQNELTAAFFEAFDFTLGHLRRYLERYLYNMQCRTVVGERMKEGKHTLIFDRAVPWLESFFALGGKDHPALFIVMPAGDQWKLRAIPPDYEHRMQVRFPLPEEWAGLLEDDLKKATGIEGAVFCHKGRFTSVWETREDALKALDFVMKRFENENTL